jgi:hypothetical protein
VLVRGACHRGIDKRDFHVWVADNGRVGFTVGVVVVFVLVFVLVVILVVVLVVVLVFVLILIDVKLRVSTGGRRGVDASTDAVVVAIR